MKNYPLVSIVTPSFNQGKFIEQTILSVINQDYPNVEYIIMDGGSNDDTVQIIEQYDEKITYWESTPDKGQTYAINKGFRMAKGKYIGWLNSDDWLERGILWEIVGGFDDKNVGTVSGSLMLVDEKGTPLGIRSNTEITFESLLNGNAQINQPGSFHRKELLKQYGFLDESLNYVMDYELWLRLGAHSDFKKLDRIVAYHRFHSASKTQAEFVRFIPEIKTVREKYGGKRFCGKSFSILRCELGFLRRKIIGF